MYHFPGARILIYMGRGKGTHRIHFHMVSEGIPEDMITKLWVVSFGNSDPVLLPLLRRLKPGPWFCLFYIPYTVRDIKNDLLTHGPGKNPRFYSLHIVPAFSVVVGSAPAALSAAGGLGPGRKRGQRNPGPLGG